MNGTSSMGRRTMLFSFARVDMDDATHGGSTRGGGRDRLMARDIKADVVNVDKVSVSVPLVMTRTGQVENHWRR